MRWVEQGADWKPHWSLIPPQKTTVPSVRQTSWPRGDIDRFVLATLESKGIAPSPEASRETWLRRVTIDLTGLPPTLAEIDAFVADRAADAYEKVVDRLSGLPRLRRADGGRMARRRALRRLARLPGRRDAPDVAVARLGDFGVQSQPAVRSLHHVAARRRPAAGRDPGAAARHGIQPEPHADPGGRCRSRGVPHRVRHRSRQHVRARVSRLERRMRAVPRPQVRPDHAEGVLSALQLLQQQQRDRTDSLFRRAEPDGPARGRCLAREARCACVPMRGGWKKRFERLATARLTRHWLARAAQRRLPIAEIPGLVTYLAARRQHAPGTR